MIYAAQRAITTRVRWMRFAFIFTVFVLPVFVIVSGYFFGSLSFAAWWKYNGWLVVGLALFFLVGTPLFNRWTAKRLYASSPILRGEQVYTFSAKGFQHVSPHSRSEMDWPSVTMIVETREFILLFVNKIAAQFLPVSAFDSEQLVAFRKLASAAVGERAHWLAGGRSFRAATYR